MQYAIVVLVYLTNPIFNLVVKNRHGKALAAIVVCRGKYNIRQSTLWQAISNKITPQLNTVQPQIEIIFNHRLRSHWLTQYLAQYKEPTATSCSIYCAQHSSFLNLAVMYDIAKRYASNQKAYGARLNAYRLGNGASFRRRPSHKID